MVDAIKLAIETAGDWTKDPSENGFEFRTVTSQGWTIRIGYGGHHQDGTACQGGMIVHLTPELALQARKRVEGHES